MEYFKQKPVSSIFQPECKKTVKKLSFNKIMNEKSD